MARSEILSPPIDGIPISDVSGLAFDLPRPRVWSTATLRVVVRNALGADSRQTRNWPQLSEFIIGNPALRIQPSAVVSDAVVSDRMVHCRY